MTFSHEEMRKSARELLTPQKNGKNGCRCIRYDGTCGFPLTFMDGDGPVYKNKAGACVADKEAVNSCLFNLDNRSGQLRRP